MSCTLWSFDLIANTVDCMLYLLYELRSYVVTPTAAYDIKRSFYKYAITSFNQQKPTSKFISHKYTVANIIGQKKRSAWKHSYDSSCTNLSSWASNYSIIHKLAWPANSASISISLRQHPKYSYWSPQMVRIWNVTNSSTMHGISIECNYVIS